MYSPRYTTLCTSKFTSLWYSKPARSARLKASDDDSCRCRDRSAAGAPVPIGHRRACCRRVGRQPARAGRRLRQGRSHPHVRPSPGRWPSVPGLAQRQRAILLRDDRCRRRPGNALPCRSTRADQAPAARQCPCRGVAVRHRRHGDRLAQAAGREAGERRAGHAIQRSRQVVLVSAGLSAMRARGLRAGRCAEQGRWTDVGDSLARRAVGCIRLELQRLRATGSRHRCRPRGVAREAACTRAKRVRRSDDGRSASPSRFRSAPGRLDRAHDRRHDVVGIRPLSIRPRGRARRVRPLQPGDWRRALVPGLEEAARSTRRPSRRADLSAVLIHQQSAGGP